MGTTSRMRCTELLLLGALRTIAVFAEESPPANRAVEDPIALRAIYLDVLDAAGRPLDEVPVEALTLHENGIARSIRDLHLRPAWEMATDPSSIRGVDAATAVPALPQRFVLLALDPSGVDPFAWSTALDQLIHSADALTSVGPVDVAVLTEPPRRIVRQAADPGLLRRALEKVGREFLPRHELTAGRERFSRELERLFEPLEAPLGGAPPRDAPTLWDRSKGDLVSEAELLARDLAVDEEAWLSRGIGRLQHAVDATGATARPLVVVWTTSGDLDTPSYVESHLPRALKDEQRDRIVDRTRQSASPSTAVWDEFARDGVSLVCWSQPTEALEAPARATRRTLESRAGASRPIEGTTRWEVAAERTGGTRARSEAEIRRALEQAGGRLQLVFASDDPSEGWREIRIAAKPPGWSVRTSPRVFVPATAKSGEPEAPTLRAELRGELSRGGAPGRDTVTLTLAVDLAPFRERLGVGAPLRFRIFLRATPPSGPGLARESQLNLAAIPPAGNLSYRLDLDVPAGTAGYFASVREEITQSAGTAGPIGALHDKAAAAAEEIPLGGGPGYADSIVVPIGEARFVGSSVESPRVEDLRVLWQKKEQRLVRVAGGAGSSLDLGIVLDSSASVQPERGAFVRAAIAATEELLGKGDRLFLVDFGSTARFVGEARGSAAALLRQAPPRAPEKSAIFDGLRFALDRFAERTDRSALIVFTDGCETAGVTPAESVLDSARQRAIPVFVVLADAQPCQAKVTTRLRDPSEPRWTSAMAGLAHADLVDIPNSRSRFDLDRLAQGSGGRLLHLESVEQTGPVWEEVAEALDHLWVVVFEPSGPEVQPRDAEVRTARGELLRPGN